MACERDSRPVASFSFFSAASILLSTPDTSSHVRRCRGSSSSNDPINCVHVRACEVRVRTCVHVLGDCACTCAYANSVCVHVCARYDCLVHFALCDRVMGVASDCSSNGSHSSTSSNSSTIDNRTNRNINNSTCSTSSTSIDSNTNSTNSCIETSLHCTIASSISLCVTE